MLQERREIPVLECDLLNATLRFHVAQIATRFSANEIRDSARASPHPSCKCAKCYEHLADSDNKRAGGITARVQ